MTIDPVIVAIACSSSAAVLRLAAMKLPSRMNYRGAVENYRVVPESIRRRGPWIVPTLEADCAAG